MMKCMPLILCLLGIQMGALLQAKTNTADYVIVGLGTSGPVIAKMLTDDKKTSVIALHNDKNLSNKPIIKFSENAAFTVLDATIGPPFYENGETIPQVDANNQEILWAVALPAGGASSINAGAYCRGTREVYSKWEEIAGPEWSVDRIFSIYKKLETYQGKTNNPRFRGRHGPLNILQVPKTTVAKKFTRAVVKATGFPTVLDYNDPKTPIGPSPQFQETQKGPDGELRVSSMTAFLNKKVMTPDGQGVDGRKLCVFFESIALRTIWEGNKAVGVEYLQDGEIHTVFANKGVIVCAGLKSSFFLLHSGVGSQTLLQSLNIPVVFNNPNVGQGLVDQTSVLMAFQADPDDLPIESNTLFQQISWLPDPIGNQKVRQLRLAISYLVPGFILAVFDLVQPKSRGSLTINSANPLVPPVIDLGDFTNPDDLALYQRGLQVYIKKINKEIHKIDHKYELISPDPNILDDDIAVREFIKNNVSCNQSFLSHCRMAPFDQGGVVDSSGYVYGVQNLIVADNSIAPFCMDGSTMATAYLIPFNIAKMIIQKEKVVEGKKE